MSSRVWAACLAMAAVALLPACGGSGDDSGKSTGPHAGTGASKSGFIRAADRICARQYRVVNPLNAEIRAVDHSGISAQEASRRIGDLLLKEVAEGERTLARLRALDRPRDDSLVLSYFRAGGGLLPVVRRAARAFKSGDVAGGKRLFAEASQRSLRAKGFAKAYGFHRCGSG